MKSCLLHSLCFYSVNHCNTLFHLRVCKLFEALTRTFAWNLPSTDPNQTYRMAEVSFAASVMNLCPSGLCLEMKMCKYFTLTLLPQSQIQAFPKRQCSAARMPLPRASGSSHLINGGLRQMEETMGTNSEPTQLHYCMSHGSVITAWSKITVFKISSEQPLRKGSSPFPPFSVERGVRWPEQGFKSVSKP